MMKKGLINFLRCKKKGEKKTELGFPNIHYVFKKSVKERFWSLSCFKKIELSLFRIVP